MTVKLALRGMRGESFADVARRTGQIAGNAVLGSATDQQVLDLLTAAVDASAAEAALSAATAEAVAGPTYPNTAAGLAATVNGESFAVDNGDGTVTVHLNSAGSALSQRTLASTSALAAAGGAALVGFSQSGTGAVPRTIQGKAQDTVSVKDFGAVGDGTTNDSAAFQAAVDALEAKGGTLLIPRGKYYLATQVTINRTFAVDPNGGYVGERSMEIVGYGAEIVSGTGVTPFRYLGGWTPNITCSTRGLTIQHGSNTTAPSAFLIDGSPFCRFYDCTVVVNGGLPAGYAGWHFRQLNPLDNDTGPFWGEVRGCTMRPWGGSDGFADFGVLIEGTSNAVVIQDNSFGGADVHIEIKAQAGSGSNVTANALLISGNAFEGPTAAIGVRVTANGTYHTTGLRVVDNRFETIHTCIQFNGTATVVQNQAYIAGNYADSSITKFVDNVSGVPVTNLDSAHLGVLTPELATYTSNKGIEFSCSENTQDPVRVDVANLGQGIALTLNGNDIGRIRYRNPAGGNGMQIAGSWDDFGYHPLTLLGCQGIAARDTTSNNLGGTAVLSAETAKAVTFAITESDGNYAIWLTGETNATLWVTSKTTTGFTINASTAVTGNVNWLLIRLV